MALTERVTNQSFDNDYQWSNFDHSSYQIVRQDRTNPSKSASFFIGDNQKSNIIEFKPSVISPEKLLELEEYKGFDLAEWGELEVSCYNKEGNVFFHNFKYLCLNRQDHNDFYPEPYLTICFELELEGIGNSKEEALDDLYQLLDMYFIQPDGIYKDLKEYTNSITAEINLQNTWKQSFLRSYKLAQKYSITNNNYQHRIMLGK
jgi:hypothetical protein